MALDQDMIEALVLLAIMVVVGVLGHRAHAAAVRRFDDASGASTEAETGPAAATSSREQLGGGG